MTTDQKDTTGHAARHFPRHSKDTNATLHAAALAFAELGRDLRRAQTVGYVVIPAGQAARYEEYLIHADDHAYRLVKQVARG